MKTTIELPDALFREAKATAARRGTALKEFVREALEEKLSREELGVDRGTRPLKWPVPPLKLDQGEAEAMDQAIEEAFERIEPDDRE